LVLSWERLMQIIEQEKELEIVTDKVFGTKNISLQLVKYPWKITMDPYYITGFSYGEACFINSIYRIKDCKTGWWVIPTFTIELHKKDAIILYQIKAYFGVGSLNIRRSNGQLNYTVASVKDLMEVIIPHFSKYPVITQK
jgi:hypothetical protein